MKRIANLFEVAAILSLLSVLAGLLGKYHHLLDLGAHLRLQATVTLLISGLALRWLKRPKCSKAALFFGVAFSLLLGPYFSFSSTTSEQQHRLFLMNVLTSNARKAEVISLIEGTNPDFAILLETDATWIEQLDEALLADWPHHIHIARSDNFGIALYSKLPFSSCDTIDYSTSVPTPSIRASFQTHKGLLRVIATHSLPPMNSVSFTARNELFAELAKDVRQHGADTTIVAGDFNCTPWSPWFKTLCGESTLHNSMRGQGLGISWTPFGFRILGIPIDHVLVGRRINVTRRHVGDVAGSDHRPVTVDFSIVQTPAASF